MGWWVAGRDCYCHRNTHFHCRHQRPEAQCLQFSVPWSQHSTRKWWCPVWCHQPSFWSHHGRRQCRITEKPYRRHRHNPTPTSAHSLPHPNAPTGVPRDHWGWWVSALCCCVDRWDPVELRWCPPAGVGDRRLVRRLFVTHTPAAVSPVCWSHSHCRHMRSAAGWSFCNRMPPLCSTNGNMYPVNGYKLKLQSTIICTCYYTTHV